ncbi:ABC transporter substrate-binding protein [Falsochrobactrum sp. TDYN1]|uniref:ABC transporter substrate-binding protein n=1 Tax=Falsochrobactrum tianjinense TaxID=2706015 RepID=A0A949UTY4_9HYPH|nr:ABC transporter substrate-binding protein [Falsochrobactrum sp. TDYN1]MBV2143232.1 ABC transporter substrate-binding protein [Falsochrobactrum sp. TDYN1]
MLKSILLAALASSVLALPVQAKEWKEIRIASEGAYPPFNYMSPDGKLIGFDLDIAHALCEAMEAECEIVANDWDGMIPGLQANKFDAVIASMAITEERAKQVAFTDRYYTTPLAVVVPKDSDIISLDPAAFDGKAVGAQAGSTQGMYADDVYGKAGADVRLYPTADEANADLESGRLDAIAADKFLAADWLKNAAGADCCKFLGDIPGSETQISVALRKGDDDLREQFNAAIKKIREDGTYDTIRKKYFDFDIY